MRVQQTNTVDDLLKTIKTDKLIGMLKDVMVKEEHNSVEKDER